MDNVRSIRAVGGEGILTGRDLEEFGAAERRVFNLMSDGQWYSADAIRYAAGKDGVAATEGLRRMRALRPRLQNRGYDIERRKTTTDSRVFAYRIVRIPAPETLF